MSGHASDADLGFVHQFEPGEVGRPPALLLHGTGGNESDLVPLARAVLPGRALLSPRGQVLENGMPRFFRRFAEGVLDVEDLKARSHALADFVAAARAHYRLAAPPLALGFSNGANIAAALLLLRPEALSGAILLRAMLPFEPDELPDLAARPVLLLSGAGDPMVPPASSARLAELLDKAGAAVTHRTLPGGHGPGQADLNAMADWLART